MIQFILENESLNVLVHSHIEMPFACSDLIVKGLLQVVSRLALVLLAHEIHQGT